MRLVLWCDLLVWELVLVVSWEECSSMDNVNAEREFLWVRGLCGYCVADAG